MLNSGLDLEEVERDVTRYVESYTRAAISAGRRRVSELFRQAVPEYLRWLFGSDTSGKEFKYLTYDINSQPEKLPLGLVASFVSSTLGLPLASPQATQWWDDAWSPYRGEIALKRKMSSLECSLAVAWVAYWRALLEINPVDRSKLQVRRIGMGEVGVQIGVELLIGEQSEDDEDNLVNAKRLRTLAESDGSEGALVSAYMESTIFKPAQTAGHHLMLLYSSYITDENKIIPVIYEPRFVSSGQLLAEKWLDETGAEKLRQDFQNNASANIQFLFDSKKRPQSEQAIFLDFDGAQDFTSRGPAPSIGLETVSNQAGEGAADSSNLEQLEDRRMLSEQLEDRRMLSAAPSKGAAVAEAEPPTYLNRIGRALGSTRSSADLKRVITASRQEVLDSIMQSIVCRFPLRGFLGWSEKAFNRGDAPAVAAGETDDLLGAFKNKALVEFSQDHAFCNDGNCLAIRVAPPGVPAFVFFLQTMYAGVLSIREPKTGELPLDANLTRWIVTRIGELCVHANAESGRWIDLQEMESLDEVLLITVEYLREKNLSHQELGAWLGRGQPAISRMLTRLEEAKKKDKGGLDGSSQKEARHAKKVLNGLSLGKTPPPQKKPPSVPS